MDAKRREELEDLLGWHMDDPVSASEPFTEITPAELRDLIAALADILALTKSGDGAGITVGAIRRRVEAAIKGGA